MNRDRTGNSTIAHYRAMCTETTATRGCVRRIRDALTPG